MDKQTKFQIATTLLRTKKLIELDFLQKKENIKSPYYTSVFIEVLIHLNHLLMVCTNKKNGFDDVDSFGDDIPARKGKSPIDSYNDIVSLVRFMRNAACHADADKRNTDKDLYVAFVFQTTDKVSTPIELQHCKYDDDIAAIFGGSYIYIIRHIVRAYEMIYQVIISDKRFGLYKKFVEVAFEGKK